MLHLSHKRYQGHKRYLRAEGSTFPHAGQNLTIGVSEVVESAVLTGSARIMKGLVTSLQLGFGLSIGESLVWWVPRLEPTACSAPDISPWFLVIWYLSSIFSV